jgi:DNA polymerase-1
MCTSWAVEKTEIAMQFPDLSQYDTLGIDTETTGVDFRARPTGCSISTADRQSWYFSWGAGDPQGLRGPADMNNCTLAEFLAWALKEFRGKTFIGHYLLFDLRMLAYVGLKLWTLAKALHCTQNLATLTNELRPAFSLNNLAKAHNLGTKNDTELHDWMARHLTQQKLKPTRKSCAPHYWRVPVEIMGPYASHDPILTVDYFHAAYPELAKENVTRVYELENALMPMLIKMHLIGVRADLPRVERIRADLGTRIGKLQEKWVELCEGTEVNYNSPVELQPWLDKWEVKYPLTPKTKRPQLKKEWLEACGHPMGMMIRRLRQANYYSNTSLESYILGNLQDGEDVIHGEFHPLKGDEYGTITGRFSSGGGLNLQNIPARDEEWAPLLRSVFRPMTDEQQWLKIDYSQIEYRLFAHYAGLRAKSRGLTSAMEQAYIDNPHIDFHDWVTQTVTGLSPDHPEFKSKRKRGKNVNFCRLYGGGTAKIALTAGISLEEAETFVKEYDMAIPEAKALMDDVISQAARKGYVRTWYGRKCRFMTEGMLAARYGTQPRGAPGRYAKTYAGLNKVLQGSAADLIKVAMIEVDKHIDWDTTQLHLQVHDELDFSIPRGAQGVRMKDDIVDIMQEVRKTPMWNGEVMRVPVIADADVGPNWGMLE